MCPINRGKAIGAWRQRGDRADHVALCRYLVSSKCAVACVSITPPVGVTA